MQKFSQYLDYINRRHGVQRTFNDFLTLCVCALSAQTQEDLYFDTISPYTKEEIQLFTNAFGSLILEMDNMGEGLKDCLGGYFEEFCSNGKNGQFFTPEPICDMLAQITRPLGATINDPACGSGRTLLASAKYNRYAVFYAADICLQCCQMTLINMCLNGLFGFVYWMDTLKLSTFGVWRIAPHPQNGAPYIEVVPISEREIKPIEEKRKEEIQAVLSPQLSLFDNELAKYDLF